MRRTASPTGTELIPQEGKAPTLSTAGQTPACPSPWTSPRIRPDICPHVRSHKSTHLYAPHSLPHRTELIPQEGSPAAGRPDQLRPSPADGTARSRPACPRRSPAKGVKVSACRVPKGGRCRRRACSPSTSSSTSSSASKWGAGLRAGQRRGSCLAAAAAGYWTCA